MHADLKQELKVIEKIPLPKKEDSTNETVCNGHSPSHVEIETQTSLASPQKRKIFIPLIFITFRSFQLFQI